MDVQLILSLVLACVGIISLAISILKNKGYSAVRVKITMPFVTGLEESRETPTAFLSTGSFPFSSLEDSLEHLKWVPVVIHNYSPSKPVSINLVWMEVLDPSTRGLLKSKLLKLEVKEHFPIKVEANSFMTIHASIRTVAEIWEKHTHQTGLLRAKHSFGTATTPPFRLDLLRQYYDLVANFVGDEILKREVNSLKKSKMQPNKLVDYANSIYGRLGFVPDLGAVKLSWILQEKEKKDSFFKPYLATVRDTLKAAARQTQIEFQKSVERGQISPPKEGERIPIFIVGTAVPRNIESILELIKEVETKTKHY